MVIYECHVVQRNDLYEMHALNLIWDFHSNWGMWNLIRFEINTVRFVENKSATYDAMAWHGTSSELIWNDDDEGKLLHPTASEGYDGDEYRGTWPGWLYWRLTYFDTVWCRYNAVNLLQNPHNRRPIWGAFWGTNSDLSMFCLSYCSWHM